MIKRALIRTPDRRDWFLVLIGCLSLLLGYAYAIATVPRGARTSLDLALRLMPLWGYGMLWFATGVYCIAAALTDRKVGGFVVASFTPTIWGSMYLAGGLFLGLPGRGWILGFIFWSIGGAVWCVAGLVDPTPIATRRTDER